MAQVATGEGDGLVRLWDPLSGKPVGEPLSRDQAGRPRWRSVLTAGCWRLPVLTARCGSGSVDERQMGDQIDTDSGEVASVAFSPTPGCWRSAGADRTVRLWDVATRRQIGEPLIGHTNSVSSVAFSPDGRSLASAGADRTVRLWDTAGTQPIGDALDHHLGGVSSLAFSPDGLALGVRRHRATDPCDSGTPRRANRSANR